MPLSPEDVIKSSVDENRLIEIVEKEIDSKLTEHSESIRKGKTLVYTVSPELSDDLIRWIVTAYRDAGWQVMKRERENKTELLFKTRYSLYRQL